MAKNKNTKVVQYKKSVNKFELNVGVVMFGIIFIYLLLIIFRYFTTEHTNVYEVRKGSIIQDTIYTGLILRNETLIDAPEDGYIQYYYTELSRISIGHNIFTLSDTVLEDIDFNKNNEEINELSAIEYSEIKTKIQIFNSSFQENSFSDVYRLKSEITSIINSNDNVERINILNTLAQNDSSHKIYQTEKSGIILYEIDGYEHLTEDNISNESFNKSNYNRTLVSSETFVNKGDEILKLVDDEQWSIYIHLNDNDLNTLKNVSKLEVRCLKDDLILPANFSIVQLNGSNYGKLEFNEGMIRYATDRFLEIELIIDNQEGFKLPLSTVIQKSFFKIPLDFITTGGNNSSQGVLVKESADRIIFHSLDFFYKDDEYVYISLDRLDLNTVLIQVDTNETYILSETEILNGVYNVNRGYATLRYVNILNKSDEYYIVEEGAYQSLINYDYIVLNGLSIEEGALIH